MVCLQVVLILVFVEFTLRDAKVSDFAEVSGCLNPCFCGIYSQSIVSEYGMSPGSTS